MAADVLPFDASRRRVLRLGATTVAGEVLMFSGVRYDRRPERASELQGPVGGAAGTVPNGSADPFGDGGNPRGRM